MIPKLELTERGQKIFGVEMESFQNMAKEKVRAINSKGYWRRARRFTIPPVLGLIQN